MRITNGTLVRTFLNNLGNNLKNMSKYQEQLSSGKQFSRPSDNPFKVIKSMDLYNSISRNEQYASNISDSIGWLDTTDTALGQMSDVLDRIKILSQTAANGTNTETERYAMKVEIQQKIEELAQIGNTVFDGRYIFGGTKTTEASFVMNNGSLTYTGGTGQESDINREISRNVILSINVSGDRVVDYKTQVKGNEVNLSSLLNGVLTALDDGDTTTLGGDILKGLQDNINNILSLRAEVGSKQNRMDSAMAKNEDETYNMTGLLSKNEDINVAEKMMQYSVMEAVYQASLMSGAKIIQPSLVDFLR